MWQRKPQASTSTDNFAVAENPQCEYKLAFLQVKPTEKEMFLKPTKETSTNKVQKLDATVYRQCDALRA